MSPSLSAHRSIPARSGTAPRWSARGLVLLILLVGLCVPLQASADDLGYFAARRILSEADDALAAGRHHQASGLYLELVEGTDPGNERHARGLLGHAVAELGKEARLRDMDAIRSSLDAYVADSAAENKATAHALISLLDRTPQTPAKPSVPAPPLPQEAVSGEDVEPLLERIATLEADLQAARNELRQKEKVIEELRQIVVEGGG